MFDCTTERAGTVGKEIWQVFFSIHRRKTVKHCSAGPTQGSKQPSALKSRGHLILPFLRWIKNLKKKKTKNTTLSFLKSLGQQGSLWEWGKCRELTNQLYKSGAEENSTEQLRWRGDRGKAIKKDPGRSCFYSLYTC